MLHKDSASLSLKQNMIWNSVGCLVYQGCQWAITVLVVVLSRDYENSGALAYAMAIGNIYYPLATYNMRTIQVSDVSDEYSSSEYVGFRIVTVVMAALPILLYLRMTVSSAATAVTALIWLLFKADESFCSVFYGIDQKAMRMDYIGMSQAIRGVLALIGFGGCLYLTQSLNAALITVFTSCICITYLFDFKAAGSLASATPCITLSKVIELLKRYFPAVITLVCYGSVVSVARQVFESICGTAALGAYAAVATPTVLVQVAASYLYGPMLGGLAKKWTDGKIKVFYKAVFAVILSIVGITVASVACSELFGKCILSFIFGDSIQDSVYLLTPALIVAATTTMFAFLFDVLISVRAMLFSLSANLVALTTSVVLSGPLIRFYGANGLNLAVISSFLLGILVCLVGFVYTTHARFKREGKF